MTYTEKDIYGVFTGGASERLFLPHSVRREFLSGVISSVHVRSLMCPFCFIHCLVQPINCPLVQSNYISDYFNKGGAIGL